MSDHEHDEEPIRAPALQPKAFMPSAVLVAADALSKKSLGGK